MLPPTPSALASTASLRVLPPFERIPATAPVVYEAWKRYFGMTDLLELWFAPTFSRPDRRCQSTVFARDDQRARGPLPSGVSASTIRWALSSGETSTVV